MERKVGVLYSRRRIKLRPKNFDGIFAYNPERNKLAIGERWDGHNNLASLIKGRNVGLGEMSRNFILGVFGKGHINIYATRPADFKNKSETILSKNFKNKLIRILDCLKGNKWPNTFVTVNGTIKIGKLHNVIK